VLRRVYNCSVRPWLVLGVIAIARVAAAQTPMKPEAAAHLERGTHLYEVQDYDGAIAELQAGYLLEQRAEFLYTIGQAYRMKGDCDKAVRSYTEVLHAPDGAPLAEAARQNIERCHQAPTKIEPPPRPAPRPVPRAPQPAPEPWYRDGWGHALVAGGLTIAAGGTVAWLAGRDRATETHNAADYGQWQTRFQAADHASTLQTVGVSAMVVGAAAVFGGIVHYRWHGARVDAVATRGGGTASLALDF